jgi:sodium-dependent dicarboxylate transporter 2/3/5
MMITLTVPMLSQIPPSDPLRKGLILSVPFAANIGGMGTPIASPPNAVAVSFLLKAGYEISFLQWVLIATPLMIGLLLFSWALLTFLYAPRQEIAFAKPVAEPMDGLDWYVVGVLVTTIGLWLTEGWHGLSTAVVALLPAVAFTATGLLTRRDVNSLEWHILILIMGGIALGVGMQETGLDAVFVSLIPSQGNVVLGALVVATILFSTFISNTAAANLLLPIGIAFAAGTTDPDSPGAIVLAASIALAASLAMSLPVSTPPNTIAYSQGGLTSGDFVRPGVVIGIVAVVLIVWLGDEVVGFWLTR